MIILKKTIITNIFKNLQLIYDDIKLPQKFNISKEPIDNKNIVITYTKFTNNFFFNKFTRDYYIW
jgi:hypothetical protein